MPILYSNEPKKPMSPETFYLIVLELLEDMEAYLETDEAKIYRNQLANPYTSRYLNLQPRRAIGKTHSIINLIEDFYPSMIVVANDDMRWTLINRIREAYGNYDMDEYFIYTAYDIIERNRPHSDLRLQGKPKPFFQLGIIEDGRIIENLESEHNYYLIHAKMFDVCKMVLELG